ncbi:MAG: 3-dehydroquinate synthase [Deferrisomatales bacterium]
MRVVRVELGPRGYAVAVGRGFLGDLEAVEPLARALGGRQTFIVSDRTVWAHCGQTLERGLASLGGRPAGRALLEPGEAHKTLESARQIWDGLVDAGVEREGCLVALGGGVVGDVAGFAAATYLRGIPFVQLPTTLLAMVDSSVGGKTGVDHPRGKNLIGAFHQPLAVGADLATLATLPRREVLSGLAEVIKAGLLGDPELFARLEERGPGIVDDPEALEDAVARAVAFKARVVAADEREGGARAQLNLGHTLGHAVEAAAGFGTYTHGEAVALGLAFAARLSGELGLLAAADVERIVGLVEAWGYPLQVPGVAAEKILDALRFDKKSRGGTPRWVVLEGIGKPRWGVAVAPELVARLLRRTQEEP